MRQVIKQYNGATRPPWAKVLLVDPLRSASYSGMVPGSVARQYTEAQTQIPLEPLARWAGVTYLNASVIDIDPQRRTLSLGPSPYTSADGALPDGVPRTLHYDVVSFDIGSRTAGTDTPGVAEFAVSTRPIHLLVRRIEERLRRLRGRTVRVVVCGAGAAGIELALTVAARVRGEGRDVAATLVNAHSEVLPGDAPMVRKAMARVLEDRGVAVAHGRRVARITAAEVVLDDGAALPYDLAIWPAGAAAHAVAARLAAAGVATSDAGWIRVGQTLQSVSHPSVFAAGDCCTFEGLEKQPGKAGVYAVRTGPVLTHNLLGFLRGADLQEFRPQPEFLRLFNCGDGFALGARFGVALYGRWVWQWKDAIDQCFMDLFRAEHLPDPAAPGGAGAGQLDAALRSTVSRAPRDPAEAAAVLMSREADLPTVKDIVNRMNGDGEYRRCVVEMCRERDAPG